MGQYGTFYDIYFAVLIADILTKVLVMCKATDSDMTIGRLKDLYHCIDTIFFFIYLICVSLLVSVQVIDGLREECKEDTRFKSFMRSDDEDPIATA